MRIGLDFDNTLTEDFVLWAKFIDLAKSLGHSVVVVTARHKTEENQDEIKSALAHFGIRITVFYTGLRSKIKYMDEAGLHVDIWIEDDPLTCALGH